MMKYTYIFLIIFLFFSAAANSATICDIDADGDVDKFDIENITAARGAKSTGVGDLRDVDGDGLITVGDGRQCVLKCTLPKCAELEKLIVVPNVVGVSKNVAQEVIASAKLMVGSLSEENSDSIPIGIVIRQHPSAGTNLTASGVVNFVVSKGPFLVVVPDLNGFSESYAKTLLENLGFILGVITRANSDSIPVGNVISQVPSAGSSVSATTKINLVISDGAASVEIGRDVVYEGLAPINPAILASLPIDVPTGKPVAIEVPGLKILIDQSLKDPISGFGQCRMWIVKCLSREKNRNIDDCARSVPKSKTLEPWLESVVSCPQACFEQYRSKRLSGGDSFSAFKDVYLTDGSCYPGYREFLSE